MAACRLAALKRAMPIVSQPFARQAAAKCEPTMPVIPVTSAFMAVRTPC